MTSPWREVGDRVWIRRYEPLDQTIGVVGGAGGLVVIDTRATYPMADELRKEVGQLPGQLSAVVNTHYHWDHTFGNARFLPSPIWGHVRCAAMLTDQGEEMRRRVIEAFGAAHAAAFEEVVLTPPTELVTEEASIDLGDRQLNLRYLGRGHTDNDLVVNVADAGVLFAGDLLENGEAPGFTDSYPIAWADTGRRLMGLVDRVAVPGHGDPFDVHEAAEQVEQLGSLAELGRDAASGAIGLDEAIRRSPFPAEPTAEALERGRLELEAE